MTEITQQRLVNEILSFPIIYNSRNYNKPGYPFSPHVTCDVCGLQNLETYVSNEKSTNFDMCPMCFNNKIRSRSNASSPVISAPFHVTQTQFPSSSSPSMMRNQSANNELWDNELGGVGEK